MDYKERPPLELKGPIQNERTKKVKIKSSHRRPLVVWQTDDITDIVAYVWKTGDSGETHRHFSSGMAFNDRPFLNFQMEILEFMIIPELEWLCVSPVLMYMYLSIEEHNEWRVHVYPTHQGSNQTEEQLRDRIGELVDGKFAYVTRSLRMAANIGSKHSYLEDVDFDVFLTEPNTSAVVFSVLKEDNATPAAKKHISRLVKEIVAMIRKFTDERFSAVFGLLFPNDLKSGTTFKKALSRITHETDKLSTPESLSMFSQKQAKVVKAFISGAALTSSVFIDSHGGSSWFLSLDQFRILTENIDSKGVNITTHPSSGGKTLTLEVLKRLEQSGPSLLISDDKQLLEKARLVDISSEIQTPASLLKMKDNLGYIKNIVTHCDPNMVPDFIHKLSGVRHMWKFTKNKGITDTNFETMSDKMAVKTEPQHCSEDITSDKIKATMQQQPGNVPEGSSTEHTNKQQSSIFHMVSIQGTLDCLKHLSSNGIDIVQRAEYTWKPLIDSMFRQTNKRPDLATVDINGDNVLHIACAGGSVQMVKHILSHEMHVTRVCMESRGQYGRTPVMVAALNGHIGVVKVLVDNGCNLSTVDYNGDNILHVACLGGCVEMVKYILSKGIVDINSTGFYGRTPVMTAVNHGHKAVVALLESKGCDLLAVGTDSDTILHVACLGGSVDMVEHILAKNIVNIEKRGHYGRTPVMAAANNGHKDVVKLLESKGCDLLVVGTDSDNILHVACLGGSVDMVEYIVSKGIVDINSRGFNGKTPVMVAAGNGNEGVVRLLVNKGCDLSCVDDNGQTFTHYFTIYRLSQLALADVRAISGI